MKYEIEVDKEVDDILKSNAARSAMSVPDIIEQLLKRYVIDAHIMEESDLWQNGLDECADLELDWANL